LLWLAYGSALATSKINLTPVFAEAASYPTGYMTETLGIAKAPTGISGLDEITGGGLPAGRPTLICGGAGCGKTLLAMSFLVRGAVDFDEPGVFVSFEEKSEELAANVASLGYDLADLMARKKLAMDYIRVERSEIEETGEYDLEGLFVRLGFAIDTVGAKRVVLDTLEALFSGLSNTAVLRAELRRLFAWLKDRGVTAIITAERGDGTFTRHGLEEYVSDCVILLDHRIIDQISTRRLRIIKYRGSSHGTNEYPFLIEEDSVSVLPITSTGLRHPAPTERVSSGIQSLDGMFGTKGFYRGSTILISGPAGTGKSCFAAKFVDAACRRGERCLYFAFEESPDQIIRNMRSIEIDLAPWAQKELLSFHATRPNMQGLERHVSVLQREVDRAKPLVVVLDPISSLTSVGSSSDVHSMLLRLVDLLKTRKITVMLTSLESSEAGEGSNIISALMDTWIVLRDSEKDGRTHRTLHIRKSRGMAHSSRIHGFQLQDTGIELLNN
jgi:circadian clock protein KaiC